MYQALSRLKKTQTLAESIRNQASKLLELKPLSNRRGPVEENGYIAPVWDPQWQQVN